LDRILVAVIDENEIFRRGVLACLDDDPLLEVTHDVRKMAPDVAVVSPAVALREQLDCPLVVCRPERGNGTALANRTDVYAVLVRQTVTPDQLISSVRAAAVGLRIDTSHRSDRSLDERSEAVLRLLSRGAATREISEKLGYSERTIKGVIADIERALGARNRAHAVAEAVRRQLI
jgi:DNA-binding CsgD family transcriptional regulator